MISTTKRLIINEWITSNNESLRGMSFDDVTIETVFEFLDNPESDIELLKSVTKKLYEIYQTGDDRLRLMTMCFIPTLVAIYIRVAHNYYNLPKAEFHSLAILLLSVYNCEIMEQSPDSAESGRLKTVDIRVISLAKPSIYHEPNSHTQSNQNVSVPTPESLAKIGTESKISIFGPYEEVEQLVASNYMSVCAVLLRVYNHHISEMGQFSHSAMCQMFMRLLRQGTNIDIKEKIKEYLQDSTSALTMPHVHQHKHPFKRHHHSQSATHHSVPQFILPRNSVQIQFSSQLMVQLTRTVYYCIYNEMTDMALEVLDLITKRATLKLYSDVLLMVNAIKNSVAIKHDRDLSIEGTTVAQRTTAGAPHTISMSSLNSFTSVTGESKWAPVKKTAITNASFKTRKLPDDIPIVTGNPPNTPGGPLAAAAGGKSPNQTPPRPSSSHHHGHALLMMQNSKNLDSIDEESSERLLSNGDAGRSSGKKSGAPGSGKKNTIINVLKELKDKQIMPKLNKESKENKENGKLANNSNHHLNHRASTDRDSDASGLSDGCGKLSLEDEEMIPMKRLNRFIDDEEEDELDGHGGEATINHESDGPEEINGGDGLHNHRSSNGANPANNEDDDEGGSDRSGSSSRGLLASSNKKPPTDPKNQSLKLSVP